MAQQSLELNIEIEETALPDPLLSNPAWATDAFVSGATRERYIQI